VVFATRDSLTPLDGTEVIYTVIEATNPFESGDTTGKYMTVRFDWPIPQGITETISGEPRFVAENISYTPEVEIRNNDFAAIPTRGILFTTRKKVLIENNIFRNMAMESIFISNDSNAWYESGPVKDMTIRNNVFYLQNADMGGRAKV